MISTAPWPMSVHSSAWAPSNLTSPGRSTTTETPPPEISNLLDTSVDITTLLKIACFTLIVAGIAALVIIKRRIRTEELEEEECPQDDGKDEDDLLSHLEKCWADGPTNEPARGTTCQTTNRDEIASALIKMHQQLDDLRAIQRQLSHWEKGWTDGPTYEPARGTTYQTTDRDEIASALIKMHQQLDDLRALQRQL